MEVSGCYKVVFGSGRLGEWVQRRPPEPRDTQLVSAVRMLMDMRYDGHINTEWAMREIELLVGMPDPAREPYKTRVFSQGFIDGK